MGAVPRAVLGLGLGVLLAGCGTTPAGDAKPVQVGAGTLGPTAWSVTVYRSVGWTDGTVTLVDHETIPVTSVTTGWGRFIVFAVPAPKTAEVIELHNAITGATEVRQLR